MRQGIFCRYRQGVATSLAAAIGEALRARGMIPADLVADSDLTEGTVGSLMSGRSRRPQRRTRDALDGFFGAPVGTTLAICEGRTDGYPNPPDAEWLALVARYEPLGPAAHAALVTLYEAISRHAAERAGDGGGAGPSRR
jgi:hypothetical protein